MALVQTQGDQKGILARTPASNSVLERSTKSNLVISSTAKNLSETPLRDGTSRSAEAYGFTVTHRHSEKPNAPLVRYIVYYTIKAVFA